MTYSPHTEADRVLMLDAVGVESVDDLFADIPASVRAGAWDVPPPLTEQEVEPSSPALPGGTGSRPSASWARVRTGT